MAVKLAVEYALTGKTSMGKEYFFRTNGAVHGPVSRERILLMLKQNELSITDKISPDKIHWFALQEVLRTLPTDLMDHLDSNPTPSPEPPYSPGNSAVNTDNCTMVSTSESVPYNIPQDHSFLRIFADTIGAFVNGSTCWQKLARKGSAAMITASFIAIISSLLLAALSCLLFARHCLMPELEQYLRLMIWLLFSGSIFFAGGIIVRLPDDASHPGIVLESLLTAALAVQSLAVLLILLHGVLFVLLPSCSWQLVTAAASGAAGLFLLNTAVILRVSLLNSTRYGSGWSTFWAFIGCWVSFMLYLFIIVPVYK